MKRLIIAFVFVLSFASLAQASEWNVPFYQEDGQTHTFVSVLNPSSVSYYCTITLKDENGVVQYTERKLLVHGQAWFFDTKGKSIVPFGTINVFLEDDAPINLAVTAMLYGRDSIALQVTKY